MDIQAATVYTYAMPSVWASGRGANIGIVSFKNMYADTKNAATVTLITTQGAAHGGGTGYANTLPANGIGVTCTVIPLDAGSAVAGIQTRAQSGGSQNTVGSATTVVLSSPKDATDFISFFVYYDGSTNTQLSAYKIYVSGNTGFTFGSVGI